MIIQEYTENWQKDFEALKLILKSALHHLDVSIEHIGSTAVPGLASKPIIDIDIVRFQDVTLDDVMISLSEIGYYHNGDQGIDGREVFKRNILVYHHEILDSIDHHLYVCRYDNEELRRHLFFRDYLRSNSAAREEYQRLKLLIAVQASQDRKVYARIKEEKAKEFVDNIIKKSENPTKLNQR